MPKWRFVAMAVVFSLILFSSSASAATVEKTVTEVESNSNSTTSVEGKESQSTKPSTTFDAQAVEETATRLPEAVSPQVAETNQAALAPKVKAAIAAGDGRSLLETTKSPDVAYDVLRYGKLRHKILHSRASTLTAPAFAAENRAHSAGCYGDPWNQYTWNVAGGTVAWVYVRENGWCGSNGAITWYGGPTFAKWSWGPFCLGGYEGNYTWDVYPSWIHMAVWASLGVSYPWGCLTYSGGKVAVRIAWNGYWDYYNDYGF